MLNLIGDPDRKPQSLGLHAGSHQQVPADAGSYEAQKQRKYQRQSKDRACQFVGCTTWLSRFNTGEYCAVHAKGYGEAQRLGL